MAVFSGYAAELGSSLGQRPNRRARGVWCSWYSLYTDIEEELLARVLQGLGDLPFEVFQVDDGWQQAVGDWEPNARFPSGMAALAAGIKATGRTAGLWLAPLIAAESSQLFRSHPDWFLRDSAGRFVSAGFNWGSQLRALDTSLPAVGDWLAALMRRVREWGFDYLKLDFLYAGALPGVRARDRRRSERHNVVDIPGSSSRLGMPREAAYRQALELMRGAMGEDAYFLACGAPIVPSLGIPDALRIGPDVWSAWESLRDANLLHNYSIPGTRNAIRTTMNRLWLQPLIAPDPDVVYFRSIECTLTPDQKKLLRNLALICDFRATSDLPQWLSPEEREELRRFLSAEPLIERTGPRSFRIDGEDLDYSSAMELARSSGLLNAVAGAVLGWIADRPWALRLNDWLAQRASARRQRMINSIL